MKVEFVKYWFSGKIIVTALFSENGTFQEEIVLKADEKTFRIKAIDVHQNEKEVIVTVNKKVSNLQGFKKRNLEGYKIVYPNFTL